MNKFIHFGAILIIFCLISGCEENIPVNILDLPDAEYYLEKSVEFSHANNPNKASAHFNTFLRFHNFQDAEIYDPDSVKPKRYAKLLTKIPKDLTDKHSLTSNKLKNIHSGVIIEEPVLVSNIQETQPTSPAPQPAPVPSKKESPETVETVQEKSSPPPAEPSRTAEKVAVAESIRQSPKLRRLIKKYTKDKQFTLKQSASLKLEEVIESFGLQGRQENINAESDGFKITLPYSAQHLGGSVGKKKQPQYVVAQSGETIQEIIKRVEQIVPGLCAKRIYRCSSFSKKVVTGKIATSLPQATKSIYLWNRDALQNYTYESLLGNNTKIGGGTKLDIFTDFQY